MVLIFAAFRQISLFSFNPSTPMAREQPEPPHIDMMMTLMRGDVVRSQKDLKKAEESGSAEDLQFRRRAYTRAVFAGIEGSCEFFRRQAFIEESKKAPGPGFDKLSVLAGETYSVTEDGEIRKQTLRMAFLSHVLFSLKSYADALGVTHRVKKGDQWHRIKNSVAIRDRITHPKNLSGLAITKKEVADINFFLAWFLNEIGFILRQRGVDVPSVVSR
jgi:hypothetical protein